MSFTQITQTELNIMFRLYRPQVFEFHFNESITDNNIATVSATAVYIKHNDFNRRSCQFRLFRFLFPR